MNSKRCPECVRPICQRILSIDDSCDNQNQKQHIHIWKEITGESLNEIRMVDEVTLVG